MSKFLLPVIGFKIKFVAFYGGTIIAQSLYIPIMAQGGLDTPISILVAALGTAIAATIVVVVRYFLDHLDKQSKIILELKDTIVQLQENSHQHASEMADRFIKRQEDTQKSFQDHIQKLTEGQNKVLSETVMAVKGLENALDGVQDNVQLLLITMKPTTVSVENVSEQHKSIDSNVK